MAYTEPKRLNGGERAAVSAKLSNRKFNTVVMSLIKAAWLSYALLWKCCLCPDISSSSHWTPQDRGQRIRNTLCHYNEKMLTFKKAGRKKKGKIDSVWSLVVGNYLWLCVCWSACVCVYVCEVVTVPLQPPGNHPAACCQWKSSIFPLIFPASLLFILLFLFSSPR